MAEYKEVKIKMKKSHNHGDTKRLGEIKHRYFHETGRMLEVDFRDIL